MSGNKQAVSTGAAGLLGALRGLGAEHAFGLPGTESLDLWEALRGSPIQAVTTSNELAAAFAAIGYFRASGRPALVLTIPGPGLAWAYAGVAEARADSAAVVFLVPRLTRGNDQPPGAADPVTVAAGLFKERLCAESFEDLEPLARRAWGSATGGEPGPVLLEVSVKALAGTGIPAEPAGRPARDVVDDDRVSDIFTLLAASHRPLMIVGSGASAAAADVRRLAEWLGSPVLTSTSARGILPEAHPLSMAGDVGLSPIAEVNTLVGAADLVLALGWRGSSNATSRFRLRIPAERLVRVDASAEVLASLPSRFTLRADVPRTLRALTARLDGAVRAERGWTEAELQDLRKRTSAASHSAGAEPRVAGLSPSAFFAALREAIPEEAVLVTDSGLHQMLARRHFPIQSARGLHVPTGLQSMGFALPAAIGAKLAVPERPVVVLLGDGGLMMTAMEMLTARRLGLSLTILVLTDGRLGLIHQEQIRRFGLAYGTSLLLPDLPLLAGALGVRHEALAGRDVGGPLRRCLREPGIHLVEVPVEDTLALRAVAGRSRLRASRSHLGRLLDRWLPGGRFRSRSREDR